MTTPQIILPEIRVSSTAATYDRCSLDFMERLAKSQSRCAEIGHRLGMNDIAAKNLINHVLKHVRERYALIPNQSEALAYRFDMMALLHMSAKYGLSNYGKLMSRLIYNPNSQSEKGGRYTIESRVVYSTIPMTGAKLIDLQCSDDIILLQRGKKTLGAYRYDIAIDVEGGIVRGNRIHLDMMCAIGDIDFLSKDAYGAAQKEAVIRLVSFAYNMPPNAVNDIRQGLSSPCSCTISRWNRSSSTMSPEKRWVPLIYRDSLEAHVLEVTLCPSLASTLGYLYSDLLGLLLSYIGGDTSAIGPSKAIEVRFRRGRLSQVNLLQNMSVFAEHLAKDTTYDPAELGNSPVLDWVLSTAVLKYNGHVHTDAEELSLLDQGPFVNDSHVDSEVHLAHALMCVCEVIYMLTPFTNTEMDGQAAREARMQLDVEFKTANIVTTADADALVRRRMTSKRAESRGTYVNELKRFLL